MLMPENRKLSLSVLKSMKSYATLADQLRQRAYSTPVPTVKPHRVSLNEADSATKPEGPITGTPLMTVRSKFPQAPPALTKTRAWPVATPRRPLTVPNEDRLVWQLAELPKTRPNESVQVERPVMSEALKSASTPKTTGPVCTLKPMVPPPWNPLMP